MLICRLMLQSGRLWELAGDSDRVKLPAHLRPDGLQTDGAPLPRQPGGACSPDG